MPLVPELQKVCMCSQIKRSIQMRQTLLDFLAGKRKHSDFAFDDFSIFRKTALPSHYIKSDISHYFGKETNVALNI